MKTFTYTWYREDDAGNIYRIRETVAEAYLTDDGGYVPDHLVSAVKSEVRTDDEDYPDAVDYLQETHTERA